MNEQNNNLNFVPQDSNNTPTLQPNPQLNQVPGINNMDTQVSQMQMNQSSIQPSASMQNDNNVGQQIQNFGGTNPVPEQVSNSFGAVNNEQNINSMGINNFQTQENNNPVQQNFNYQQTPNQDQEQVQPINLQQMQQPAQVQNQTTTQFAQTQNMEVQNNQVNSMNSSNGMFNQGVNNTNNFSNLNNGIISPSTPLTPNGSFGSSNDITNVGFVAVDAPLKKKNKKPLIITIVLVLLVGLGLLGYFVVYPFVMRTFFSNPMNVYEVTIRSGFKAVNSSLDEIVHDKSIYDLKASFDTNIQMLTPYTGYTYNFNFGYDPNSKAAQLILGMKNNSNIEYSFNSYLKNGKEYSRYSSYRDLIYIGDATEQNANSIMSSFNDIFGSANDISKDDLNYLIDKLSDLTVKSLEEDKITKEDASITINGETLKVINNKYEINYETFKKMSTTIQNGLADDDKVLDILVKLDGGTKDEIKESLKSTDEIDDDSIDKDLVITTNIYTYGLKNEIIGFRINTNEDDNFHYYSKDENYFEIKSSIKNDTVETTGAQNVTYSIVGKKEGNVTGVTISYNDKVISNLKVREWNENLIDFDYEIIADDSKITGSFKLNKKLTKEKLNYVINLGVKIGEEYINSTLEFNEDWTSEVANINTGTAVTLTQEELSSVQQNFLTSLMSTPIGILFQTVSGFNSSGIMDYYQDSELY